MDNQEDLSPDDGKKSERVIKAGSAFLKMKSYESPLRYIDSMPKICKAQNRQSSA
jgi:hypothetical protein